MSDQFPNEDQKVAKVVQDVPEAITVKSTTRLRAYYSRDDELTTHAVNCASEWIASQEARGKSAPRRKQNGPPRVSSLNAGAEIMRFRSQLAKLTSVESGLPPEQAWDGEIRTTACQLQRALQSSAEYIFSQFPLDEAWKSDSVPKAVAWTSSCRFSQSSKQASEKKGLQGTEEHLNVGFQMYNRDGKWSISNYQLEAVLGLWLWSLKRSELLVPTTVEHLVRSKMVLVEESRTEEIEAALYLWVTQTRQVREYGAINATSGRDSLSIPTSILAQWSKQSPGVSRRPESTNTDGFTILGIPTNGSTSLLQFMAQDIYTVFINRIVDIVGDLRGTGDPEDYLSMRSHSLSTAYGAKPLFELTNPHIDALANALVSTGIATREEALMSIVPPFLHRLKLPLLDEDMIQSVLDRAKSLRRESKFREGAALIAWMLSGCPRRFHKQGLRCLGDLYRRAALSKKGRDNEFGLSGMRNMEKRYSALVSDCHIQDILTCYAHLYESFHHRKPSKTAFKDSSAREKIKDVPGCPSHSDQEGIEASMRKEEFELALTLSERVYFPDENDMWDSRYFNELLQWALKEEFPELIEDLWTTTSSPQMETQSPLLFALKCGCELETIHSLLDWPGIDVDGNEAGFNLGDISRTPLICAIEANRADVACSILRRGAALHQRDKLGMTPLHHAFQFSDVITIQTLLDKGANIHETGDEGRTALHFAATGNSEAVIQFLLEQGTDIHEKDNKGQTALHFASEANNEAVIQFLLEKGADVRGKDNEGRTALHSAAKANSEVVIQYLLERGTDIHEKDNKGRTLLHFAATNFKHEGVTQLLVKEGSDIHGRDDDGRTPLHLAAATAEGDADTVLQLLLEMGANIHDKDLRGRTPLHLAVTADGRIIDRLRLLLKMGANIHGKDSQGRTPLHLALAEGAVEHVVPFLLHEGANVHDKDSQGRTPLHLAAASGSEIEVLLANGAVVYERDKEDLTPLHVAVQHGRKSVVRLLLEKSAGDGLAEFHDLFSPWPVFGAEYETVLAGLFKKKNVDKPLHVEGEGEGEEVKGKDTTWR